MPSTPSTSLTPSVTRPRRRRRSKWIKRGVLGLIAAGALGAIAYGWMPAPVVVDAATVARGPLEVTVDDDGRTRVRERFVVAAPVGGQLERIELDPGTAVVAGEVLARIRPPVAAILDARGRDEARARLAAAIAGSRRAETVARSAAAAAAVATRDAARARAMFAGGAISAATRERAELAAQQADADRAAAEAQRAIATADVRAARAVVTGGSAGADSVVPVLAPASGEVLRVLRDDAGPIAAGTPVIELGDPAAVDVVVDVLSTDAARIAPGAPATITGWGGDRALTGTVRRVEPSAVTKQSALGIEEQRVDVVIALDAVPPELGDGFRVEASIQLWRGDDVLAIPAGALFRDRGTWAVYAIAGGRAHLTAVDVGRRGRTMVEVVGLAPGARIILHPSDRVRDGTRVTVRANR